MKILLLVALVVVAALAVVSMAYRRRKLAEQRRAVRDQRRAEQLEVWNRHMSGRPSGPGHRSPLA